MKQFKPEDFVPKSHQRNSLFLKANQHTLFQSLVEVYYATMDTKDFQEVHIVGSLGEWVRLLYEAHGFSTDLVVCDKILEVQQFPVDKEACIHLVTAGKDSTATALKFEAEFGAKNYLLHVQGVNKMYPTEHRMCKALYTKHMPDSPYNQLKVPMPRVSNSSESPIKNMFITVLAIEYFGLIPKYITLGGSAGIADVSETEVFGDSSRGITPFLNALNNSYGSDLQWTPYLRDQIEAYEVCEKANIDYADLASCMSQLRFKAKQRGMALDKYSKVIDGRTLIAGNVIATGKSIFDTPQATLDNIKIDGIEDYDQVYPDSDYRCLQGCFKCREKAVVYAHHFGYKYHPEYMKKCKDGIIGWMDKSPNNNGVKLEKYFDLVLGIPLTSINKKYHAYIAGEAKRPDGWKPPRKRKAAFSVDQITWKPLSEKDMKELCKGMKAPKTGSQVYPKDDGFYKIWMMVEEDDIKEALSPLVGKVNNAETRSEAEEIIASCIQ